VEPYGWLPKSLAAPAPLLVAELNSSSPSATNSPDSGFIWVVTHADFVYGNTDFTYGGLSIVNEFGTFDFYYMHPEGALPSSFTWDGMQVVPPGGSLQAYGVGIGSDNGLGVMISGFWLPKPNLIDY
jgi:hypothetical protein